MLHYYIQNQINGPTSYDWNSTIVQVTLSYIFITCYNGSTFRTRSGSGPENNTLQTPKTPTKENKYMFDPCGTSIGAASNITGKGREYYYLLGRDSPLISSNHLENPRASPLVMGCNYLAPTGKYKVKQYPTGNQPFDCTTLSEKS